MYINKEQRWGCVGVCGGVGVGGWGVKSGTGVLQTRRDNQYVFLPHWLLVN